MRRMLVQLALVVTMVATAAAGAQAQTVRATPTPQQMPQREHRLQTAKDLCVPGGDTIRVDQVCPYGPGRTAKFKAGTYLMVWNGAVVDGTPAAPQPLVVAPSGATAVFQGAVHFQEGHVWGSNTLASPQTLAYGPGKSCMWKDKVSLILGWVSSGTLSQTCTVPVQSSAGQVISEAFPQKLVSQTFPAGQNLSCFPAPSPYCEVPSTARRLDP